MSKSTEATDTTTMDLLEKALIKDRYVYNKEYGTYMQTSLSDKSVENPLVFRDNQATF